MTYCDVTECLGVAVVEVRFAHRGDRWYPYCGQHNIGIAQGRKWGWDPRMVEEVRRVEK